MIYYSQYDGKVIKFHGSSHHQPEVSTAKTCLNFWMATRWFVAHLKINAMTIMGRNPSPQKMLDNVCLISPWYLTSPTFSHMLGFLSGMWWISHHFRHVSPNGWLSLAHIQYIGQHSMNQLASVGPSPLHFREVSGFESQHMHISKNGALNKPRDPWSLLHAYGKWNHSWTRLEGLDHWPTPSLLIFTADLEWTVPLRKATTW
jgi:hypothetical protein